MTTLVVLDAVLLHIRMFFFGGFSEELYHERLNVERCCLSANWWMKTEHEDTK